MIKKNKIPLLSICIPTYNRAKLLKQCLDSIVCQFIDYEIYHQVEIVISDNNSQDNTTEVVKGYQKKYANIRYFKNKENVGSVVNTIKVTSYAKGEYIWIFSDDDLQYGYALNTILTIIKKNNPDALYCNIALYSRDMENFLEDNVMLLNEDVFLKSKKELFKFLEKKYFLAIDWFTSYISGIVFSRRVINDNYRNIKKMDPKIYMFPHIAFIYYNTHDYKIYAISKTIIKYRTENAMYESGRARNEREFMKYFYQTLLTNDYHIYTVNRKNISLKLTSLLILKHLSRGLRLIFLKLFNFDISRILIRLYYGKYPLKLAHSKVTKP